jgi:hypothetical protein
MEKTLVCFFFLAISLIGVFSFKSYGISWDEAAQRLNGGTSLIYVAEKFAPSLVPPEKRDFPKLGDGGPTDHGVAFDAPLVALEQILRVSDSQSIYELRHFVNFFVFILGTIGIFDLIKRRFQSYKLGLLGALFFVVSPRFFAEGFYNNKDIIFTCILVISMNFNFRYLENNKKRTLIFAGVLAGLATNVRVAGIGLIPAFALGVILVSLERKGYFKQQRSRILVYLFTSLFTIYLFFPWIWADPISRFWQTITSMSKYNWNGNVLYAGQDISALNLPWHYAFTWIGITTPILYLLLSLFGSITVGCQLVKIRSKKEIQLNLIQDTIMFLVILAPLLSIFALKPVFYDGWRHLYFIYPSIIYLSILGWQKLFHLGNNYFRVTLILITTISLVTTSHWMFENRPMQNLYFNKFAGKDIKNNWDFDYWGLGNRNALDFIQKNSGARKIKIKAISFTPLEESIKMLNPSQREKFVFIKNVSEADYLINNYRMLPKDYNQLIVGFDVYKQFKSGNETFLTIYKRKPLKPSP